MAQQSNLKLFGRQAQLVGVYAVSVEPVQLYFS